MRLGRIADIGAHAQRMPAAVRQLGMFFREGLRRPCRASRHTADRFFAHSYVGRLSGSTATSLMSLLMIDCPKVSKPSASTTNAPGPPITLFS